MSVETAKFIQGQQKTYVNCATPFHVAFGVPLKQFWKSPFFGFDLVEFDDWVMKTHYDYMNGSTSLKDFIELFYGDEARDLVVRLIDGKG